MSVVQSLLSLPAGALFAATAVLIILLALWLSSLFSRRHFITIRRSEETELVAFNLRRIADALERISAEREIRAPAVETTTERPVGMSAFGR
jgi:hypothetical protein